jgi:hypothetical protein
MMLASKSLACHQHQQQQQQQFIQANTHQQVPVFAPAMQGPTGVLGTNMTLHELTHHPVSGTFAQSIIGNTHNRNHPHAPTNQIPTPVHNSVPTNLVPVQMSNGQTFYHSAHTMYCVNGARTPAPSCGALNDGGANGGLSGKDMRMIETSDNLCHVKSIAGSSLLNLKLGTGVALIETTDRPNIGKFHQYALYEAASSVHAPGQLRAMGHLVDDMARSQGGKQCITTHCGEIIPLSIRDGLPHMSMRPPTDDELELLPHVSFTSPLAWDPKSLDDVPAVDICDEIFTSPEGEQLDVDPDTKSLEEKPDAPSVTDKGSQAMDDAAIVFARISSSKLSSEAKFLECKGDRIPDSLSWIKRKDWNKVSQLETANGLESKVLLPTDGTSREDDMGVKLPVPSAMEANWTDDGLNVGIE